MFIIIFLSLIFHAYFSWIWSKPRDFYFLYCRNCSFKNTKFRNRCRVVLNKLSSALPWETWGKFVLSASVGAPAAAMTYATHATWVLDRLHKLVICGWGWKTQFRPSIYAAADWRNSCNLKLLHLTFSCSWLNLARNFWPLK
jgi:hypothetical protein